jgi:hypothetical protein
MTGGWKFALEIEKVDDPDHFEAVKTFWFDSADAAKEYARLHLPYETRVVRVKKVWVA